MRVKVHSHADFEPVDAKPLRRCAPFPNRFDDMVGSGIDELAIAQGDSIHGLAPVVGRSHDTCNTVRVVDLTTDLVAFDDLADRDHAFRR